jgi:hypothetical protein
MSTLSLTELYEEYLEARRTKLSYEQFAAFVLYYPALLVAKTDGEIDEQEWLTLQGLANQLVNETLSQDTDLEELKDYRLLFFDEFRYVIATLDRWDRKFMKALKYMLSECPDAKQTVAATIYSLADASKGVCEKENTMIEYLRGELNINELDVSVRNRETNGSPKSGVAHPKWQALFASFWLFI